MGWEGVQNFSLRIFVIASKNRVIKACYFFRFSNTYIEVIIVTIQDSLFPCCISGPSIQFKT